MMLSPQNFDTYSLPSLDSGSDSDASFASLSESMADGVTDDERDDADDGLSIDRWAPQYELWARHEHQQRGPTHVHGLIYTPRA